jgi:hypothetical protein
MPNRPKQTFSNVLNFRLHFMQEVFVIGKLSHKVEHQLLFARNGLSNEKAHC